MNPLFRIDFSISDSLKIVRKSVLIYETIIARLDEYDKAIMSPAYPIFRVKDKKVILPEYLDMWFKRPEFDREAAFIAVGGVRGSMPWEEFEKMQLPVPPIEEQLEIVASYKAITDRIALKRRINDNLAA